MSTQLLPYDPIWGANPIEHVTKVYDPNIKSYQTARLSALRMALAGATPGLWASNHLEELRQMVGWTFIAVHAFCLQMAGSEITAYRERGRTVAGGGMRHKSHDERIAALLGTKKPRIKAHNHKPNPMHATGRNDEIELPPRHPLVKLMRRPNPNQSGAQFRYQLGQQIKLTGSALIWILRDGIKTFDDRGTPRELYCIPTGFAIPQPPTPQYPMGWYRVLPMANYGPLPYMDGDGYMPGNSIGQLMILGGEIDMRHTERIGWPHPMFLSDSLSPLSACAVQVDIANELLSAIWSKMTNGGMPGLTFSVDAVAGFIREGSPEMERFREDLKALNDGARNAGKNLLVPGGLKVDNYGDTSRDMDFEHGRPDSRDDVMAAIGTPSAAAGYSDVDGYSKLYATLKSYKCLNVQPNLDMMIEKMGEAICPAFGPGHSLRGDAPSIEDPDVKAKEAQTDDLKKRRVYSFGLRTVDQACAMEGLDPYPDPAIGKQQVKLGGATPPAGPDPAQHAQPGGGLTPGGGLMPSAVGQQPTDTRTGTPNPALQSLPGMPGKAAAVEPPAELIDHALAYLMAGGSEYSFKVIDGFQPVGK